MQIRSSQGLDLIPLITRLTVGHYLDNQDRNARQQKDVDEAAFVKDKLQNEPNNQQTGPNYPHFRLDPTLDRIGASISVISNLSSAILVNRIIRRESCEAGTVIRRVRRGERLRGCGSRRFI